MHLFWGIPESERTQSSAPDEVFLCNVFYSSVLDFSLLVEGSSLGSHNLFGNANNPSRQAFSEFLAVGTLLSYLVGKMDI